jgi:putative membrane protein
MPSMLLRIALAATHLLALAIGWSGVRARASAARQLSTGADAMSRVFAADNAWGVSALLFLGSGLWRLVAGTEKATTYYANQPVFWIKMGLFGAVFALELWPMITLIQWRRARARSALPDAGAVRGAARRIALLSDAESALLVGIVICATLLARGYGAR